MPAPKSHSSEKLRSRSDRRGPNILIPLSVIIVLVVGFSGFYWVANKNSAPSDSLTLCRTDQPPPSVNVILIDVTDSLSIGEQAQISSEIERIRTGLSRFSLLEIYTLGRRPFDVRSPSISLCNPGRGADMNAIYQNPEMVERKWRLEFVERLNPVLNALFTDEASNQSLILEAVRAISLMNFSQPKYDQSIKNLYVFSDFLQHVPGVYSQYNQPIQTYEIFKTIPYAAQVHTNLIGVSARLFYISRPDTISLQNGAHQKFWVEYFASNGAVVEEIKRIFGDK